jgi:hypothetical protein
MREVADVDLPTYLHNLYLLSTICGHDAVRQRPSVSSGGFGSFGKTGLKLGLLLKLALEKGVLAEEAQECIQTVAVEMNLSRAGSRSVSRANPPMFGSLPVTTAPFDR